MKRLHTAARAANVTPCTSDSYLTRLLVNGARSFHSRPPRLRNSSKLFRPVPKKERRTPTDSDRINSLRDELRDADAEDAKISHSVSRGSDRNFSVFTGIVDLRFKAFVREMREWTEEDEEYRSLNFYSPQDLTKCLAGFRKALNVSQRLASGGTATTHKTNPIFHNLRSGFIRDNIRGLDIELKYAFQSYAFEQAVSSDQTIDAHLNIADMRYPHEWFPATRTMQRTVHLHVGPTNSGKTYHALKALENAKSGIYAGPLRLLAHEVYSRFKTKGIRCALITGEELRIPEGDEPYFQSCTVEMTPLNDTVDVAVIDEIQMIADSCRGYAWTDAFFGVQAKELHLCGEARTVDLIRAMCARIGDECIVHRYERLNPLEAMSKGLDGNFKNLQKGDCVVSFSRLALHGLKAGIEKATGKRCAIVYGALPPETRAQQAALFNDPDNEYDFLVASDAIGMGLNLEIKRVIFESVYKRDDVGFRQLTIAELKQIGGRAGRYRTAAREMRSASNMDVSQPSSPSPGLVCSLENPDIGVVRSHMDRDPPPIEAAGLQIPHFIIERFSRTLPPGTPLSFTLLRLRELCRVSGRFFLCSLSEYIAIADIIQPYPLSLHDRCVLLTSPVMLRDPTQQVILKAFAECICGRRPGTILDNLDRELNLDMLDTAKESFSRPGGNAHLVELESLHRSLTMYLWLSYRYPEVFSDQALVFHIKEICEEKISSYLEEVTFVPGLRARHAEKVRAQVEARMKEDQEIGEILQRGEKVEGQGPAVAGLYEGDEEPLVEDEEEAGTVEFVKGRDTEVEDAAVAQEESTRKLKWSETNMAHDDRQSALEEKTERAQPVDQLAQEQPRKESCETHTGA